jgi:2-amino-4-hydroxy-6-hydroxymethyldihydropteridine diphosphokinase
LPLVEQMKTQTFLLLGTNLGDRKKNLTAACRLIEKSIGTIVKRSSIYETEPWGKKDQGEFLNQALEVETGLSGEGLLKEVMEIEKMLGRMREERWGERTMDIDILFYGNEIIVSADLVVPHPRMAERRFVLEPLSEIGGDVVHPVVKMKIREMLERCEDRLRVVRMGEEEVG